MDDTILLKSVDEYFKANSDSKFSCAKCGDLLLNAFQSSCGCFRCCGSCANTIICDECNNTIEFFPDKALSKELRNCRLQCCISGCKMILRYEDFFAHIGQCEHREIVCQDCNSLVPQSNIKNHKSIDCEYLVKQCNLCKQFVRFSKTKHISYDHRTPPECSEFRGECCNCSEEDVKLKPHYENCNMKPCLLKQYGCVGHVRNTGICSALANHVDIINTVVEAFIEKTRKLSLSTEIGTTNQKSISLTNLECEYLKKEVDNIQQIFDRNLKLYQVPKCGKYVWIIRDFSQVLCGTSPLLSEPFYSDTYGYKLCLKIYPQGDGVGKGQYLSVYYVIMKGAYDDLLAWPFYKKVKITIFNQNDIAKSKSELYRPGNKSASTIKPSMGINLGTGNPMFISLAKLKYNGFIKEDTMFIEIAVNSEKTFL